MRTKGLGSCDDGLSQLDLWGNLNKGMRGNNLMNLYLENLWHVLESCLCSHFVVGQVQLCNWEADADESVRKTPSGYKHVIYG
jgi:hypothetical protein